MKLIANRVILLKRQEEHVKFKIKVTERKTENLIKQRKINKEAIHHSIEEDRLKQEELARKQIDVYRQKKLREV